MRAAVLLLALAFAASPAADAEPAATEDAWEDPWATEEAGGLRWTGFVEGAAGWRWDEVENLAAMTLGDARLRVETTYEHAAARVDFEGDLNWDEVVDELDAKVRELALAFRPAPALDLKLGRQVLTWGTGDLLFLNDLFPKDFVSFFAGRDEEYLKAPSDTLRASAFSETVNVELAWTPRFTPDEYLYGERFAFFDPTLGRPAAPEDPMRAPEPDDPEWAVRAFRQVGGTEYAAYGYTGRWKQPLGVQPDGTPFFPRLDAWGASARTGLGGGLFNAEFAWYDSKDDPSGDDPRVPNSQLRILAGYERELVRNLTAGGQVYAERTLDYGALLASSPSPALEPDEWRTVVTVRLTHRALRDTLISSLFVFVSPSDEDWYARPMLAWRRDDHWTFSSGLNLLGGRENHTFFGQLEDNSNGWLRVRFNY